MKAAVALAMVLGACVVEDESTTSPAPLEEQATIELEVVERGPATEADICGLAADLARDDVCSLVCDPEGFQARLLHDGVSPGRCYQFRCEMDAETVVSVGLCLP